MHAGDTIHAAAEKIHLVNHPVDAWGPGGITIKGSWDVPLEPVTSRFRGQVEAEYAAEEETGALQEQIAAATAAKDYGLVGKLAGELTVLQQDAKQADVEMGARDAEVTEDHELPDHIQPWGSPGHGLHIAGRTEQATGGQGEDPIDTMVIERNDKGRDDRNTGVNQEFAAAFRQVSYLSLATASYLSPPILSGAKIYGFLWGKSQPRARDVR
jgi:hypothetical protein